VSGIRFGLLAEDKTDCDAVAVLVRRIAGGVTSERVGIDKHATGGCAELRKKARAKMAQMAGEGPLELGPRSGPMPRCPAARRRQEKNRN
jgi:hypothetical protein